MQVGQGYPTHAPVFCFMFSVNCSPPVILLGMHRSGTSLLARLLHEGGVFMGWRRNSHDEALFFLGLNERLFRLAHAAWDQPAGVTYLAQDDALRIEAAAALQQAMASWRARSFWGWRRAAGAWGWKDPRTVFTLPIWWELFPQARVVRLCRHPLDVAHSLQKREQNRRDRLHNPLFSARCLSLEGAFSLWVEYETMSRQVTQAVPPAQVYALRYEDLVQQPAHYLAELQQFLGVTFAPGTAERAAAAVNPQRAFAFRRHDHLLKFYEGCRRHPLLQQYGYDRL